MLISLTIAVTSFLCILNAVFAFVFRKRSVREVLSYLAAGLIELVILSVAMALRLGLVTTIPYHLPPGLPFNRAEIGAALAIGIGLLPAAYWHRNSAAELRTRMAEDAKAVKEASVQVRTRAPGDWIN